MCAHKIAIPILISMRVCLLVHHASPALPNLSEYTLMRLDVRARVMWLRAWLETHNETHDGYTPDSCSELKAKLVSCMLSQGMEVIVWYSSRTIL